VEANDFVSRLNDRVPLQNKMLRSLAGTDSALFGKFTMALDLKTRGLPDAFAANLSGPITFSIKEGRIVGVEWTKSLSASLAKAHSSLGFEQLAFSELKGDLLAENALLGQLQKFAPGVAGASLFPTDNQGRALLYYNVGGDVSSPKFSLDAKRMASEGGANAASSAARAALAARAAEERAKLEAAARAKLEAEKKVLQDKAAAESKKLQEKAAAEAKKQGKKVLEGLKK
jgi:hypothetical protein